MLVESNLPKDEPRSALEEWWNGTDSKPTEKPENYLQKWLNQPNDSTETKNNPKKLSESIANLTDLVKESNKSKIYSETDLKYTLEPKIKLDAKKEIIEHMKTGNCSSNCDICNIKNENLYKVLSIQHGNFTKTINDLRQQNSIDNQKNYETGLINGIKTMNQNSGQEPKDVFVFCLKKVGINPSMY